MNQNNMHMVPQVIIDCAENLFTSKQDHMKDAYKSRLETIRDYCEDVLKKSNSRPAFTVPVKKKSVSR
jgi:hypothetical protein